MIGTWQSSSVPTYMGYYMYWYQLFIGQVSATVASLQAPIYGLHG
jgi:hypothetical protein